MLSLHGLVTMCSKIYAETLLMTFKYSRIGGMFSQEISKIDFSLNGINYELQMELCKIVLCNNAIVQCESFYAISNHCYSLTQEEFKLQSIVNTNGLQ